MYYTAIVLPLNPKPGFFVLSAALSRAVGGEYQRTERPSLLFSAGGLAVSRGASPPPGNVDGHAARADAAPGGSWHDSSRTVLGSGLCTDKRCAKRCCCERAALVGRCLRCAGGPGRLPHGHACRGSGSAERCSRPVLACPVRSGRPGAGRQGVQPDNRQRAARRSSGGCCRRRLRHGQTLAGVSPGCSSCCWHHSKLALSDQLSPADAHVSRAQ